MILATQTFHNLLSNPWDSGLASLLAGLGDGVRLWRPKTRSPGRLTPDGFAFVVHPRSVEDIRRVYPLFRRLPPAFTASFFQRLWPLTIGCISGLRAVDTGQEVPGWIIAVPMSAEQLLNDRHGATRKIVQALCLAEQRGARLVGLGALLPALTRYGQRLQGQDRVSLTTGHALTTWSLSETVERLLSQLHLNRNQTQLAICGAAGSIGSGLAHVLAGRGIRRLLLFDRPRMQGVLQELQSTLERLSPGIAVRITPDKAPLRQADLIVTATNAPTAVLASADLRPGSIIVNDAQPSDISPDVMRRDDVLVLEGGLVTVPGIDTGGVLGLPRQEDVFGCLGETIVLAAHGWSGDYTVGKLDPSLVDRIGTLAQTIGVQTAPFQTAQRLITEADLSRMKAVRIRHRCQESWLVPSRSS